MAPLADHPVLAFRVAVTAARVAKVADSRAAADPVALAVDPAVPVVALPEDSPAVLVVARAALLEDFQAARVAQEAQEDSRAARVVKVADSAAPITLLQRR